MDMEVQLALSVTDGKLDKTLFWWEIFPSQKG